MKNLRYLCLLCALAVCTMLPTGCIERPDEVPGPDDTAQGGNKYDYATTRDIPLNLDYARRGSKALFEIYAQNPVNAVDGAFTLKPGVKALLRAYTDNDGKYSGVVNLPTAVGKVYVYSESYGFPACIEADVTAGGISCNVRQFYEKAAGKVSGAAVADRVAATRADAANPYNVQQLGDWTWEGKPLYILGTVYGQKPYLNIAPDYAQTPAGMMNRIQNVLMPGVDNSKYAMPTGVVNLNVTKDAHLTLVFAAELAAWRNAIGYYYYDTQNPPRTQAEFDALPKYVAFPNCSSFTTNFDDPDDLGSGGGDWTAPLFFGEQLRLTCFRGGKATDIFPAGTTVGWFMLPDAYEISAYDYTGKLDITGSKHPARYSNNEFNAGNGRYMVSLYDKVSGKTVLGFEDGGDNDYKDVLFYVDSDPADAIYDPDRPTTDPGDEKYPDVAGDPVVGTLAFEDLWPSQGDYDMNDVVVGYSTTFTVDKDNRIVAIRDVVTPLHSGGKLRSAFGYQLDIPVTAVKGVKIENGSSTAGLEKNQDKAVVILFDDIEQAVARGPVSVEIKLDGSLSMDKVTRKSLYNPFICVSDKGFVPGAVRKEIHLTNYPPTSLADPYPFGRNDDKSSLDKAGNPIGPYYYATSELYPFAIDLPVTDYRIPDEMVKIDVFYPYFADWVKSRGEKHKEWYKNSVKQTRYCRFARSPCIAGAPCCMGLPERYVELLCYLCRKE